MPGPSSDPRRRRLLLGGAVVLALLVLAGAAIAIVLHARGPEEVADPSVEFAGGGVPTTQQRAPADAVDRYDDGADWPVYGANPQRTRYLPVAAPEPLRPPLVERWGVTGKVLLEFPPVLCGARIYALRNDGVLRAVDRRTGRVRWTKRIGSLAASAPACGGGRVYATVLRRNAFVKGGELVALSAETGERVWRLRLAGRTESSPLLTADRVIFGTEDGDVLSVSRRTGRVDWRYAAGAPVKAAVALDGDALYVGDYAGTMHSIWLRTGRKRWTRKLGGRLYSTPAVAYGRVYVGNVDGSVAAIGERTGRVAWRRRTKGFVYSAPAVAPVAGRGPTVFIGSYGGVLYAYDARTGRTRWSKNLGGKISGGITVVGDNVLYANLGRRSLGIRRAGDGALLYSHRSGAFDPGISDGRRFYIDTYTSVYHLVPKRQVARDLDSFRNAARRRAAGD
jgi:outer membrane protein assembly factor BamB